MNPSPKNNRLISSAGSLTSVLTGTALMPTLTFAEKQAVKATREAFLHCSLRTRYADYFHLNAERYLRRKL